MKLCYQVATPDVKNSAAVTSYQAPLEEAFANLSQMGYNGVELMSRDPKSLDWSNIKNLVDQYHLDVVMICTGEVFGQDGLTLVHPNKEIRELAYQRALELVDYASCFGANMNIGRFRGHYVDSVLREKTYDLAVKVLRNLAVYAESQGVTLVIEPVTMLQTNFINSTQDAIELVKEVNQPGFRLMMDIYHANIEDKNIYESIQEAAPYLSHVHVADNNRRIPGTCGFDFKKIISTLKSVNYQGDLALELFQIPDQETAARESYRYLKKMMGDE